MQTRTSSTPDALASVAYLDGRRARLQNLPCTPPGAPGSAEHEQWSMGWRSANSEAAYEDALRSAA